jgi:hypothetical protein
MMQTLQHTDTAALHKAASFHAYEVLSGTDCGCFYCMEKFNPQQITEWTDDGQTALCPHCHMDAVIPSSKEHPISSEMLEGMNRFAF